MLGIIKASMILLVVSFGGAFVLGIIENMDFSESLYRTLLLIATVSEYPAETTEGKLLSIGILFLGLGAILYLAVNLTRLIIGIDIEKFLKIIRRKRK